MWVPDEYPLLDNPQDGCRPPAACRYRIIAYGCATRGSVSSVKCSGTDLRRCARRALLVTDRNRPLCHLGPARSAAEGVSPISHSARGLRPAWGSFNSRLAPGTGPESPGLAGSNGRKAEMEITTAQFTHTAKLIASRSGDALFGYFLALGQKVTRPAGRNQAVQRPTARHQQRKRALHRPTACP